MDGKRGKMKRKYSDIDESTDIPSDEFTLIVESADKPKGACEAVMHLHLIDDDIVGEEEELSVVEFPENSKRGHRNSFTMNEPKVQSVTGVGIRGDMMVGSAGWNIDKLKVINNKTGQEKVIPIFTSIKAGKTYKFLVNDVALPQFCCDQADRQADLDEMRALYQLTVAKVPGGPPLVKRLPPQEDFSFCYKLRIGLKLKAFQFDARLKRWLSREFKKISDIQTVYHWVLNVFPEPSNLDRWRDDALFGMQRLMGVNCNVISLCTEVPSKLAVNSEMLTPFLEKKSLSEALTKKRIFIIDYKILKTLPTKDGFVMTAPIALFYQREEDGLIMPIAIQLFQKPGHHNPVFLPSDDENTWILAKMWFNVADANYHQSITHLGHTHLKMEGIVACTHRQIHKTHPIFKLLMPHFLYLVAINSFGLHILLDRGEYVDKLLSLGSDGMKKLIARKHKKWRMDVEGTLPSDLKQRGVYDKTLLPHYYFRDDAIELYNAIHLYVGKYLDLYYASDKDVKEDYELQKWRKELVAPVKKQGLAMKGVFGEHGKFNGKKQICLTLTSIIYTCSAHHAAVNFRQYEEYAYPPNYPLCLRGTPPKNKLPLDEQDLLHSLPDKTKTYDTMVLALVLSTRGLNKLGDFEVQYITDEHALKVVKEFQADLSRIAKENVMKNRSRLEPYTCLNPNKVPNSISI